MFTNINAIDTEALFRIIIIIKHLQNLLNYSLKLLVSLLIIQKRNLNTKFNNDVRLRKDVAYYLLRKPSIYPQLILDTSANHTK